MTREASAGGGREGVWGEGVSGRENRFEEWGMNGREGQRPKISTSDAAGRAGESRALGEQGMGKET
jgi:hypothetical protein